MKKIPTIFIRDPETGKIDGKRHNPLCEWVFRGEGVATQKLDGTCCMIAAGQLYKRRVVKKGKDAPEGFTPVDYDKATGKAFGWMPVGDGPEDEGHRHALMDLEDGMHPESLKDSTYELCGPGVNGNPEKFAQPTLIKHGLYIYCPPPPRSFDALVKLLSTWDTEGIVWHHEDGRMAKIKKRDLGLGRRP